MGETSNRSWLCYAGPDRENSFCTVSLLLTMNRDRRRFCYYLTRQRYHVWRRLNNDLALICVPDGFGPHHPKLCSFSTSLDNATSRFNQFHFPSSWDVIFSTYLLLSKSGPGTAFSKGTQFVCTICGGECVSRLEPGICWCGQPRLGIIQVTWAYFSWCPLFQTPCMNNYCEILVT